MAFFWMAVPMSLGAIGGLLEREVLEAPLNLCPFTALGHIQAASVMLEGLVENDHKDNGSLHAATGGLCQFLQEMNVTLSGLRGELKSLASFVQDD